MAVIYGSVTSCWKNDVAFPVSEPLVTSIVALTLVAMEKEAESAEWQPVGGSTIYGNETRKRGFPFFSLRFLMSTDPPSGTTFIYYGFVNLIRLNCPVNCITVIFTDYEPFYLTVKLTRHNHGPYSHRDLVIMITT